MFGFKLFSNNDDLLKKIEDLENRLDESLNKKFLNVDNGKDDENLSSTAPKDKVILDDENQFFKSINDTFFNDGANENRKASENIPLWRRMSTNSIYARYAIEQIINEAIVYDGKTDPIKLDFVESSELKDSTKRKINQEWDYISKRVLKIKKNMATHFKIWYVDGIIVFENIYNNDNIKKDGVRKVKVIDPVGLVYGERQFKTNNNKSTKTKKVWSYSKTPSSNMSSSAGFMTLSNPFSYSTDNDKVYFEDEQISYSVSDIYDHLNGNCLSYLNFAVRPLNQLFAVENAFVVFALTRSTDKLVYYVDVGNMPEPKARAKIQEIARDNSTMSKYDSSKGTVIDSPDKVKLTNEIYLARRNGTKGTEIDSLSATNVNLGDVSILAYLKDNLDTSLFMPRSRRNKDYKFQLGYAKEIDYEELAFYKLIMKLRNLFVQGYIDIFGKHLISKKIVTQREWEEEVKDDLNLVFTDSTDYERMKYIYDLQEKINVVDQMFSYVKMPAGSEDKLDLFTIEHDILKKVFQLSDDEIDDWKKRMTEIKSDVQPDQDQQNQDVNNNNIDNENNLGYVTEDLLQIYQKKTKDSKFDIKGDVEFKDIDTFSNFFEYLKEDDEIVVKKDGKVTNIKWKIKDGELVEL